MSPGALTFIAGYVSGSLIWGALAVVITRALS